MYPSAICLRTGEVTDSPFHIQWYGEQLKQAYHDRKKQPCVLPSVEIRRECRRIVVLNCLDHLYGHSLLKLLNAHDILRRHPDLGLCLLVPKVLRPLIPANAAEVWEVDLPLRDGVNWYDSIAQWISNRLSQYDEVFISQAYSHLSPRNIDLNLHLADCECPDLVQSRLPVVSVQLRQDRFWGESAVRQEKRIRRLYDELRWRFHRVAMVLIGIGQPAVRQADGLFDLRTEELTPEIEREWFSIMRHTDVTVGVHGSNMLIPSGLARSTVELLPQFKYPNLCQDLLFSSTLQDPREVLLRYSVLYGDDDLLEISPERLAAVIASQVTYSQINRCWFRLSPDDESVTELRGRIKDVDWMRGFWTRKGRGFPDRIRHAARKMLLSCASWLE